MKYNEVVRMVNEILGEYSPATVRQVYYRLVSPPYRYMENSKSMYTSFDRMMVKAREEGLVDWQKIADNTREVDLGDDHRESPSEFLNSWISTIKDCWMSYEIDMWENQPQRLIVFVEKDALAGVMRRGASFYQVPVVTGRGYGSLTQLMELSSKIVDKTTILYFGDFDPTGLDIDRSIGERLLSYGSNSFELKRIALTEDDIRDLPPNPTKASDTRAKVYNQKYGENCWELDAIPPGELEARVSQTIKGLRDVDQWEEDYKRLRADQEWLRDKLGEMAI